MLIFDIFFEAGFKQLTFFIFLATVNLFYRILLVSGDVIEVVGSTDSGLLEGVLRGRTGLLPRHLVQEVRFRSHANNKEVIKEKDVSPRSVEMSPRSVEVSPRVGGRREGEIMKHFGTATKSGVTFVTGWIESFVNK